MVDILYSQSILLQVVTSMRHRGFKKYLGLFHPLLAGNESFNFLLLLFYNEIYQFLKKRIGHFLFRREKLTVQNMCV